MTITNYDNLIPKKVLFNLKQIEDMGLIKVPMIKKLIFKGEVEVVKIGNKLHLSRTELIRYLETHTYAASN